MSRTPHETAPPTFHREGAAGHKPEPYPYHMSPVEIIDRNIRTAQARGFYLPASISTAALLQLAQIESTALPVAEILTTSQTKVSRMSALLKRRYASLVDIAGRVAYIATDAGRELLAEARLERIFKDYDAEPAHA